MDGNPTYRELDNFSVTSCGAVPCDSTASARSNRVGNRSGGDAGDEKQEVLKIGAARDGVLVAGIVPKFVDGSEGNAQSCSDGDSSPMPESAKGEDDSIRGGKVCDLSNEIEKPRSMTFSPPAATFIFLIVFQAQIRFSHSETRFRRLEGKPS